VSRKKTLMKNKVVRLPKLKALRVHPKDPDKGVGPCALELFTVLNCWSDVRGGTPDAADCKAMVQTLTECMRKYVLLSLIES
jgi:hypothetical protein